MKRAPRNILTGTVTAISVPRPQTARNSDVIPRTAKVVVTVDIGHGLSMVASMNVGPPRRSFKIGDRVELEVPASSVIVRKVSAGDDEADEGLPRKPKSREDREGIKQQIAALKNLIGDTK